MVDEEGLGGAAAEGAGEEEALAEGAVFAAAVAQAVFRTQAPMSRIAPVSSAMG